MRGDSKAGEAVDRAAMAPPIDDLQGVFSYNSLVHAVSGATVSTGPEAVRERRQGAGNWAGQGTGQGTRQGTVGLLGSTGQGTGQGRALGRLLGSAGPTTE